MKLTKNYFNTIIIGSGAAGFNSAKALYQAGVKDIAIFTNGINMGTSRNTGSDKQTYYKLNLCGREEDSVRKMAEDLFKGGSMHGDNALTEAALSARCFFALAESGVPFPFNSYGEYVGYQTDHDSTKRATSAGPLTSKFMTEALEKTVKSLNIPIYEGFCLASIIKKNKESIEYIEGAEFLHDESGESVFITAKNIVLATGGPGDIYSMSVYPESQHGANGIAFRSGVHGENLTESQYGLASVNPRWNVSGSYQQVIPRYISTDEKGLNEREFLSFESPKQMFEAIFLKGYQWPFDPKKLLNFGSSIIDLMVYNEICINKRRVFLDYTKNPQGFAADENVIGKKAFDYLKKSGSLGETPIKRLEVLNKPAIELYKSYGHDLYSQPLEIILSAQHNNGGLAVDKNYESNIKGLFIAGEAAAVFGTYRPGGSALNSTQVSSLRSALYISKNKNDYTNVNNGEIFEKYQKSEIEFIHKAPLSSNFNELMAQRQKLSESMSKRGAVIRSIKNCEEGIKLCDSEIEKIMLSKIPIPSAAFKHELLYNFNMAITQKIYLSAIKTYIKKQGTSRGSYLIVEDDDFLNFEKYQNIEKDEYKEFVLKTIVSNDLSCSSEFIPVRTLPNEDIWFEKVWAEFRNEKF